MDKACAKVAARLLDKGYILNTEAGKLIVGFNSKVLGTVIYVKLPQEFPPHNSALIVDQVEKHFAKEEKKLLAEKQAKLTTKNTEDSEKKC